MIDINDVSLTLMSLHVVFGDKWEEIWAAPRHKMIQPKLKLKFVVLNVGQPREQRALINCIMANPPNQVYETKRSHIMHH